MKVDHLLSPFISDHGRQLGDGEGCVRVDERRAEPGLIRSLGHLQAIGLAHRLGHSQPGVCRLSGG
jgi:hypothetical protein